MLVWRRAFSLSGLMAAMSAAPTSGRAVDATSYLVYSAGPIHVRPHLAVSERYDDNIFYRPSDEDVRDDLITILSPGVNFQLGRKTGNYLLFDYTMDQSLYVTNGDEDSRDHTFSLESDLEFKRLTVEGRDRVQLLSGILGGGANLGRRVDRVAYNDRYTVELGLSEKTGVYMGVLFDALDFEPGTELYDYNTLQGTAGFGFKFSPKTTIFGEAYYGQAATEPNTISPHSPYAAFVGGYLGVRGEFTPRLTGLIKAGYEVREYSDDTPAPSAPVVELSLDYRYSEKTSANLNYSRRNSVSVQVFQQTYIADIVSAQFNQVLGSNGKLVGTLGGMFENAGYEQVANFTRHDIGYRAYAKLTYNFQLWLSASLGFEHEAYRSNENQVVDYDVNRVTLRVAIGY